MTTKLALNNVKQLGKYSRVGFIIPSDIYVDQASAERQTGGVNILLSTPADAGCHWPAPSVVYMCRTHVHQRL